MINIQDIIPFMKDGWVAMDKDGYWYHHEEEPHILWGNEYWSNNGSIDGLSDIFPIRRAKNWTKSLIKVGGNTQAESTDGVDRAKHRRVQILR